MPDMLVKLYELPPLEPALEQQRRQGITIRRALAPEKRLVLGWVEQHWGAAWASECDVAFANQPPACFVAVADDALLGFACYDATARGFFGPIGVVEATRGRGVGAALLVATLHAMRWLGYGYAIIGGVGPAEFYARTVGATLIPDSAPGIYQGMLRS
ncbi:GNAT family N-acetyltransferase [Kallotenue papyrolyticum]|uniref:GNAT family N-acetyltransferase n=1 Tax=Kallotenue papyrolyticum TaxID=1325125 RepID=UPI00046F57B8|nr:GNAT family N-acetyltransferase [Kallotenue papyrolyticum]